MAALALMTVACSNDDNDIQTPAEQPANNMVTITAQLAPKSGSALTRAVADNGDNKITVTWAVYETLKIISANGHNATATITAVDGTTGAATISFNIDAAAKGQNCTIIYPADAAVTESAGEYTANPITAQDGTLKAALDVRIGKGTITDEATPQLDVTTQPAAQFAIFKFTTKNSDASATINVKPLTVTTGGQDYVITPASATSELFAALPPISSKAVTFTATGSDSKTYICSKDGVTFAAAKYYQSTLKMSEPPLLTTITGAGSNSNPATSANVSYSTEGVATLTFSEPTSDGNVVYSVSPAWGWWGYAMTLTVTPAEGYTITKCVFYDNNDRTATDSEAPFVVETTVEDKTPKVNGTILADTSKGIKKIEVYGYVTP